MARRKLRTTTGSVPRPDGSVHDRRAKDLTRLADVAPIDVPDPMALNPGDKITVLRQLRSDPLARLHAHGQVTDVQYLAGVRYQNDFNGVAPPIRAIDTTKEKVDGGAPIDPLPERRLAASERLDAANSALGREMGVTGIRLIRAFLIDEENLERLALSRFNRHGERWSNYYGRMLRDALDVLAIEYGLRTR